MNKLTREQAAVIGVFTGVLCGPFEDIQKLGDELMGRPTWTHEYGNKAFSEKLNELVKPRFIALCADRDEHKSRASREG